MLLSRGFIPGTSSRQEDFIDILLWKNQCFHISDVCGGKKKDSVSNKEKSEDTS